MAETIWEKGKLKAVYQPAGRRENGELRYRRANFDVLEWTAPGASRSDTFVVPLGLVRIVSADTNLNANDGDAQLGHEFGYYDPEITVVEPHEGDGRGDSWKSLHCFGYV